MEDEEKHVMPHDTLEERQAVREACRQMLVEGRLSDPELAEEFCKAAAVTVPKLLDALEVAEGKHGGKFGEELRELFRSRFTSRFDGRELLRHDVQVWNFQVAIGPTGTAFVDVRLVLEPRVKGGDA